MSPSDDNINIRQCQTTVVIQNLQERAYCKCIVDENKENRVMTEQIYHLSQWSSEHYNLSNVFFKKLLFETQDPVYLEVDGGGMRENNTWGSLPFSSLNHSTSLEQWPTLKFGLFYTEETKKVNQKESVKIATWELINGK